MLRTIRIGTRDSQLAIWQATQVLQLFKLQNDSAELVFIKSEGDIDLKTPLYEMGVQGIFTRSLDIALLNNKIDIAVHSMKDVPTQLPMGISQAAVLKRGPVNDMLVYKTDIDFLNDPQYEASIATSSIRRKAQWLHRFSNHHIHNLRGNINSRLHKLSTGDWDAAIFAQAGLERINLRPEKSVVLDWMLPAPAQGAILAVCRKDDIDMHTACEPFNDIDTALCTSIERQFLHALHGGCSTPIGALAEVISGEVLFKGNLYSPDGKQKAEIEKYVSFHNAGNAGEVAARELLESGGKEILEVVGYEK